MFEQVALPSLKQAIGVDQDLLRRQQINGSNQAVRGWNSADISEDAAGLMWKANQAKISGDTNSAAVFEQQGRDLMQQASQWAPTVRDVTDVNSVESFGDWAGGALGNVRSSIKPALGGLAGAAIGAVAAPFTGGVINPLLGARVGAGLAGYNTMTESNVADMMMDERIRANRTAAEIANAARWAGAVQGALESVVPAGVAGSVVGLGGRKAAAEIAKNGLLKTAGKRIGIDTAEEFATEFAQNPVGDIAKNYLKGDALGNVDWQAALNAGAAGAVAGGGMGAVGAGFDAAHAQLGKGVDKAKEIKSDPLGTILDAGVDLAAKAGTAKAKLENYFDERELKKQGFTDDQIAEKTLEKLFSGKREDVAAPHSPEEKLMEPMAFDNKRKESADRKAAEILKANSQTVPPDVRQAAVDYASGKIDWLEFGKRENDALNTQSVVDDADAALAALEGRGSKKSLMRPTLIDDHGEQEGRSTIDDTVTDDHGNLVGRDGAVLLHKDVSQPAPFNYNSAQRSGGIDKAQRTDNSNRLTSEISPAVQRVAQAREDIYKTKTTEAQAIKDRDTVDLAKLIVNNFGTDKEVAKAARNATENYAHVSTVAGMITWARFGFQRSENQEVLDALVKTYGASASKIMRKAYEQGVHQGIVERNDEKAGVVEQALERTHVDSTARYDAVIGNLTPTARAKADGNPESVAKLLSLLQDIVSRGEKGGNTKDGAGVRSATDKAVLKALFGTEENIRAALAKFVEPKSKDVLVEDKGGKDEQDGSDLSAAVDALESEGESSLSESGNTINTTAKHTDLKRADGKLFDKRDLTHRAEMDALRKKHSAVKSGDVMGNEVEEVGVVTQALAGLDTDEARQAAKRDIVHEYFPKLDRIGDGPAEDASLLLKRDFATRLRKYNRKINALAIGLDKRHVALRVTEREMERMPLEFSRKVVEGLELQHMNLDDPKNGPHKGVLVFEMADKNGQVFADNPFKTSGPMIMRQMFRLREAMGDAGSSYKDGVKGTAQGALRLLSDGITSIITEKDLGVAMHLPKNPLGYFTGRYGYVMAGKTTWVEGTSKLPDDFMLYRDKKLGPQTAGMAAEQEKDQSKSTKSVDFDPEDVETGIVTKKVVTADEKLRALLSMTEKRTDISPQAIGEIHGLAAQVEAFEKILLRDTEEGKKLIAKQSAVIEGLAKSGSHEREGELAKLKHFNTVALHKTAQGRAKKVVLGKKINALYKQYGLNSTTSEQRATKHEQERAVDGLAGYDKRGEAALGTRTERGDINSGDDTMLAQAGTVGRSRSGTAPVASRKVGDKIVDERVSDNVTAEGVTTPVASIGVEGNASVVPRSAEKMKALLTIYKNREVRTMTSGEASILTQTINILGDKFKNQMWAVAHIAIGRSETFPSMGRHHTNADGTATLIISERGFTDLRRRLLHTLAHETAHSIQNEVNTKAFAKDGKIASLARQAVDDVALLLSYPLNEEVLKNTYPDGRDLSVTFARELHAQLFAMYHNPKWAEILKVENKELYNEISKHFAVSKSGRGDVVGLSNERERGGARRDGRESASDGVTTGEGAVRSDAAKNKLIKQLESVKTYTPRHRAAVRNALAILKGTKEGDINEALEAVLASSEYFGKNVKTEAQAEIEEMNEAVADAADDYYEHERSRESGERDYAAEYEDAQETELGPEPVVEEQVVETAPKQSSEAQQLQAYLDQHGSKNAPWAGAARKAIASNNETQIRNTLAAGKKQFGAVNVESVAKTLNVYFGTNENKELSNLAQRPFTYEGRPYRSVEHAYQSLKSGKFDPDAYESGKNRAKAPGKLGTDTANNMSLMKALMSESFKQNPEAAQKLLATGDAQITHTQDNGVWREAFPRLLMEVRAELGAKQSAQHPGANPKNKEEFEASVVQAADFSGPAKGQELSEWANALQDRYKTLMKKIQGLFKNHDPFKNGPLTDAQYAKIMRDGLSKDERDFILEWVDESALTKHHDDMMPYEDIQSMGYYKVRRVLGDAIKDAYKIDHKTSSIEQRINVYGMMLSWAKQGLRSIQALDVKAPHTTNKREFARGAYSSEITQLRAALKELKAGKDVYVKETTRSLKADGLLTDEQIDAILAGFRNKDGETKNSAQRPGANPKNKEEFEASVAQAAAHIIFTIGKNIKVDFEKMTDGSGSWTPGQLQNTIKLALNGDVLGAAFHESFHEFMDILRKNAATKTADVLQRAAMNPMIQRKLERLLDGHPEAIAQLKDPEEAAAFMYQFWSAGLLKIGPETRTAFDTVKNFLKKVAGFFSETFRSEVESMTREQLEAGHAELLLRQFSEGAVANMDTRQMVVEAMEKNTEVHNAAVERVGSTFNAFANGVGKLVFSSEAMMEATGNKHMVEIMRGMHQKVGTAMRQFGRSTGAYSDGLRQNTSHWMHKVEAALAGYSKEDLELARAALSQEKEPTDRVAKEIVAKINEFYGEMAQYMKTKGVKRLNMDRIDPVTNMKGVWEDIPLRKNYLSQVWSIDKLMESLPEFKADLLKHHMKELEALAVAANKELKDMKGIKAGTAAGIELDRADKEFKDSGKIMAKMNLQTITPEMIADAIGTRLLASHGHIEISESTSGMGITPAASAVNKRELNWLDKEVFDKYKEKDLTNILTTYAHSIVKRGEFQSRFGPAGEVIAEGADKAVLFELGGDALVDKAVAKLPAAKKAWAKAKAENGEAFDEPFPTIRSVGQNMHAAQVGQEKHDAALLKTMKKLQNGFNAIQALEGTLGRDITPGARALNSWLVTYQSFRTLSTMLFTSFQDVAGIVVNGGEAGDAWNAFVEGIREIRNTVFDNKDPSARMKAAEFWGTVDAGAFLETSSQAHGSPFMSGKAKQWSDTFFKYTGAVGWNRGVRAVATQVAERIITGWKTNGIDRSDKAAVARLEDLFGKGFDPANIKVTAEGRLDPSDVANQAAITRWVLTAVPAPTAAHRTIWMSDPHYAIFAQLKNYIYSFHRIMMKNAADQARLGNYRPVLAMLLGYTPIAIAAGAIKEMLIPGEEPPWMKGGLDGYLSYGFARAGVLGVPQMLLGSVLDASQLPGGNFGKAGSAFDPASLAGPTADQVQNILSIPFGEFMAMRDHTIIGEGLGALPGGNLVKRLERLGSA